MSDWQKDMEKDWTKVESKPKPKSKYVPVDKLKEAQERKKEFIGEAQNNKNSSIRMAGAIKDAVLITTATMKWKDLKDEQIKEEVEKWFKWIYKTTDIPFI